MILTIDDDAGANDLSGRIRDAILTGRFAPHQRLIEADLSEQFSASRAAVRVALLTLANEGLIERMPHKGARVRSVSVDEAIEIAEVRVGLEALCARKAALLASPADHAALRALRAEMFAAVETGDLLAYSELNRSLHALVQQISGHGTAVALLQRLRAQSARHQFRLALHPGRAAASVHEHAAIIDAILSADADAAEAAMRGHLQGVLDVLAEWEDAPTPS